MNKLEKTESDTAALKKRWRDAIIGTKNLSTKTRFVLLAMMENAEDRPGYLDVDIGRDGFGLMEALGIDGVELGNALHDASEEKGIISGYLRMGEVEAYAFNPDWISCVEEVRKDRDDRIAAARKAVDDAQKALDDARKTLQQEQRYEIYSAVRQKGYELVNLRDGFEISDSRGHSVADGLAAAEVLRWLRTGEFPSEAPKLTIQKQRVPQEQDDPIPF